MRFLLFLMGLLLAQDLARGEESIQEENVRIVKDIPYADRGEKTKLDLYLPSAGKDLPIVIWVHGGGWQFGDKKRIAEKPPAFNSRKMIFVSVNYRLHPETDFQGQASDLAEGIKWVVDHAADHGGSPQKIFLLGHSAGAHLSALVCTDRRYLEKVGLKLSAIRGVILLDGAAYNIPRQIEIAPPRMKEMYLTVFGSQEEKQTEASPWTYVESKRGIPPFLVFYVATRRDGKMQSEALAEKLKSAEVNVKLIAVENKTHATISGDFGRDDDEPTRQAFEFLNQNLKQDQQ